MLLFALKLLDRILDAFVLIDRLIFIDRNSTCPVYLDKGQLIRCFRIAMAYGHYFCCASLIVHMVPGWYQQCRYVCLVVQDH